MVKIIYLEDTINLMGKDTHGVENIQRLARIGQFKETQSGYRYIVIELKPENNV